MAVHGGSIKQAAFLADCSNGRAYGTILCSSVLCHFMTSPLRHD